MVEKSDHPLSIAARIVPAEGFYELGLFEDAWLSLDHLPDEDKAHPLVVMLRLDILLGLHRLEDAVVLGTSACQNWPRIGDFFLKTATALIDLSDHSKAKDLLVAGPLSLQQKAVYWYQLARCHGRLAEIEQSRKCLSESIHRDTNFRTRALDDPDLQVVWE